MFETDKYDRSLHTDLPAAPEQPYAPEMNLREMSLLFWGEHCVECAAPSCYQSCDLYQPRSDQRCRRFAFGAKKNRNFRSLRGYGVEISFKKWAKIEAFGNLSMAPVKSVLRYEKFLEWIAPVGNGIGNLVGKLTGSQTWRSATYIGVEKLVHRLGDKNTPRQMPDSFLLEVYNPARETVRMQLIFGPYRANGASTKDLLQLEPSFTTTVAFPDGYSRHEVEAGLLRSVLASGRPFKISMIPEADNNARLVFLTADFVKFEKKPSAGGDARKIKCVVWDLDNTLWNGILIEGDDVAVRPEIVQLLKHFDERGILLSIASKNDHASAFKKLEQLGLSEYFLYPQINWMPKSAGIKRIAQQLNLGIDSLAFVDDNPFELDQVSRELPQVLCVRASDISSLSADPRFQGSSSVEARRRRQFYQEAISREHAQAESGSDYLGFLASCKIVLEIASYAPEDLERVAELVQRTNQLNFSGHKYTRAQLDDILANPKLGKYVLRSSDKYGSYGTVGFSIVEQGTGLIQIRDFMLSCRVQGKFIEQAFFHHLFEHHNSESATRIWVNFRATDRNKPAQQVLESLGFVPCGPASDRLLDGMLHSSPESLRCDFIQSRCAVPSNDPARAPGSLAENVRNTPL